MEFSNSIIRLKRFQFDCMWVLQFAHTNNDNNNNNNNKQPNYSMNRLIRTANSNFRTSLHNSVFVSSRIRTVNSNFRTGLHKCTCFVTCFSETDVNQRDIDNSTVSVSFGFHNHLGNCSQNPSGYRC